MNSVDLEDLNKTKGSFQSKSNKLRNSLDGSEYIRFYNIVSRNWTGEEAQKFLVKLEESVNICKEEIKNYNNMIQSLIDSKMK